MTDLTNLSASKLRALADKRGAAWARNIDKAIAAGRGHWTAADMRVAANEGDAAARENVASLGAYWAVLNEMDERRRYHGTLAPIRRRA